MLSCTLSAADAARLPHCVDIEPELRLISGEFLRRNGLTRIDGMALLPAGQLPS